MKDKTYTKEEVLKILTNLYSHREHVIPDFQPKIGKLTIWAVSSLKIKRAIEKIEA